ncbi:MAG: M20/M25/M40 family metallo-hydrolase [Gemmatimonadota bacterium]
MKTLLFRALLAFLVVSGLLTATLFVRSAFLRPQTLSEVAVHPFDFDAARALDRLTVAIRIPPEPTPEAPGFPEFLASAFPAVHAALVREAVAPSSFLYTWSGTDPELEPVLLVARMGPAPTGPGAEAWRFPPFSGELADGAVWGRGTLSGRGPLVAIFEALDALLAEGFDPARTLMVAVGGPVEEEGSGLSEVAALLESRGIVALWALGDGGGIAEGLLPGVTEPIGVIGTAEQGALALRLTARGVGGPASAPPRGTAAGRIAEAIVRLEDPGFTPRIQGPTRRLFLALAPHMDPGTRMLAANLWLFERPLARALSGNPWLGATLRTVAAPTLLRAEADRGALPSHATARLRVGIAPWDAPDAVLEEIWARLGDLEIELLPEPAGAAPIPPSAISSTDTEGFLRIRDAARAVFPDLLVVLPATVPGVTDVRPFSAVARDSYRFVPFRMNAATLASLRGANERIPVTDYVGMIRFYGELIRRGTE